MTNELQKELISSTLETQNALKSILLDYMQKLADSTDIVDIDCTDSVLSLLNDFKNALELFKTNTDLLSSLDNVEAFLEVSKNTLQIEKVLQSALKYFKITFSELSSTTSVHKTPSIEEIQEVPVNEKLIQPVDTSNITENTLIISEMKGKVFLPYTTSLLEEKLKNNSSEYSNIEDIIEKEYTLSFDMFKNLAVARFREAFNLIRKKEKGSIKEAFDLGMELLFNYNLHPAIIAACKNLDELDIYLDYLENNETDKFDCFKIIFDIAPVVVKKRKS